MRVRVLLVIALAVGGCGEVKNTPTDGGVDAPSDTPAITFRVANPTASVPLGGSNRVIVEITRSGGFAGAVTVAAMDPPAGLSVTEATIPADASRGEVLVSGAPPLTLGGMVSYTLLATGDGVDAQMVTLSNAPVTGRPGALDTTFGPGTGLAAISLGADDSGAFHALDVINGNVLAIGHGTGGLGATRMIAMRFTAAGVPDPTWNNGALVRSSFGGSSNQTAQALATGQQNDGRSIAIGDYDDATADIALVRFSLTGGGGGADFGDGTGKSLVNLGGVEHVTDGLVLSSNQILAVGDLDGHYMIARMTSAGLLDTTFNTTGFVRTLLGASSSAEAVTLDDRERLVVAGSFDAGNQRDLTVRRYAAAGALDGAFGTSGVLFDGPDSESAISLVAVGDKLVLASTAVTTSGTKLRLRRLLSTGALDTGFGTQGVADLTVAPGTEGRRAIVLPDGRIVVLAAAGNAALLIRFTADGAVDTLFGTTGDGTVNLNIGDSGAPQTLSVYSDHLIVVGGGNQGGTPGPGTFAVVARMWM